MTTNHQFSISQVNGGKEEASPLAIASELGISTLTSTPFNPNLSQYSLARGSRSSEMTSGVVWRVEARCRRGVRERRGPASRMRWVILDGRDEDDSAVEEGMALGDVGIREGARAVENEMVAGFVAAL